MVKNTGITMADWLFEEIEKRRGAKGRSEFISELCARGLGFSTDKPEEPKEAAP